MSFSEDVIQEVWEKGIINITSNPHIWRQDICGAWIARNDYGNQNSPYSWKIVRLNEGSKSPEDETTKLQPLHWKNDSSSRDGRIICRIESWGTSNVQRHHEVQMDITLPQ
jgi:hypothetical protein